MVGCVLSQLKPSALFLAVAMALAFFKAKNVELLGLYSILNCKKPANKTDQNNISRA